MDKFFSASAIMEMATSATIIKTVDLEEISTNVNRPTSGRKPVSRADRRRAGKKAEKRREQKLRDLCIGEAPQGRARSFLEKKKFSKKYYPMEKNIHRLPINDPEDDTKCEINKEG